MQDVRIARWAHTLVHYSLALQPGEILAIESTPGAAPLIEAGYQEALNIGAYPIPFLNLETLDELLLQQGNEQQLNWLSPLHKRLAEKVDARLFIHSSENIRLLVSVDPARAIKRRQAMQAIYQIYHARERAEGFRWCMTLYPTQAYAQNANMLLREFEEFVFATCFLNDPDPIASWKAISTEQQRLIDWLRGHDKVHILAVDTGSDPFNQRRPFINEDGIRNFPSGEFFTSPLENSANGVICFFPSTYDGRRVEGVRLVFRDGKVVEASASQEEDYLQQMLNLDKGSRYLGEFAFGNNAGITRLAHHILFDEKMGGTIDMALGNSLAGTYGINQSAIHWDMVCDLRSAGEVRVDGTLFLKDGKFMA
ncbi:aminopeptidase [Ktedonosporobacter rubrisoli]|uniref:Aminopeptidase n=1 Tax=Ktedonosporobacter rubrisoli TaxID=2509675 RepID=A0A4V0Z0G3_KTERU|nr:aminopeptidase [Ktedonosporobacter rubrisoli]QBD83121.1 aminopeptidase [Ktedonosporobacter rubrisoli]